MTAEDSMSGPAHHSASETRSSGPAVCFNRPPMDPQPARHLLALLSALDPSVAEPAVQPLERLASRGGAADVLINALVGTSGVGKSELLNALAGSRVVATGPLRPTTTDVAIWGSVDPEYLPGTRISDPEGYDGLALVDTPAAEHYPDTVAAVLDRVDAVTFVTSLERYADAITATLLATIRERGIPMLVVLSIGPRDPSDFGWVDDDAGSKLETPIDLVVGEDMAPLRDLFDRLIDDRSAVMDERDRAAAVFSAARTREVAGAFEEQVVAFQVLVDKADDAFTRERVDRRRLADLADEEWEVTAPALAGMTADAADEAISELAADVAQDDVFSRAVADASLTLPSIDQGPIDDWYRETTDLALASMKRRWLHPRRSRAVRDAMWRLSIDFDRRPTKRVRRALRDHLPDLRFDGGVALTRALRDAGSARITEFKRALDPSRRVSPEDLRSAADAVEASGSPPSEADDDVA